MFTLDFVWLTNCSYLSHCRMTDKARFYFHRTQTMATDFNHIVYASLNSQVAIFINSCGIPGEVHTMNGIPVGLVACRITVNSTHQAWPWMTHNEETSFIAAN